MEVTYRDGPSLRMLRFRISLLTTATSTGAKRSLPYRQMTPESSTCDAATAADSHEGEEGDDDGGSLDPDRGSSSFRYHLQWVGN